MSVMASEAPSRPRSRSRLLPQTVALCPIRGPDAETDPERGIRRYAPPFSTTTWSALPRPRSRERFRHNSRPSSVDPCPADRGILVGSTVDNCRQPRATLVNDVNRSSASLASLTSFPSSRGPTPTCAVRVSRERLWSQGHDSRLPRLVFGFPRPPYIESSCSEWVTIRQGIGRASDELKQPAGGA